VRFNPSDRSRLGLAEVKKVSKLEELSRGGKPARPPATDGEFVIEFFETFCRSTKGSMQASC